mgnify:CR=1 FL=1
MITEVLEKTYNKDNHDNLEKDMSTFLYDMSEKYQEQSIYDAEIVLRLEVRIHEKSSSQT